MLDFPCRCGHVFHVDQTLAGEPIQCPDCRKLVIIPTTSDLAEWEGDGTYRVGQSDTLAEPGRIDELFRTFTRTGIDETGQSIDNRQSLYDPNSPPVNDDPSRRPPRYDPETGERLRALEIGPVIEPVTQDMNAIPAAGAAVPYAPATLEQPRPIASPWHVPARLFMPINAADMFFVLLFHVIFNLLASFFTMVVVMLDAPLVTISAGLVFLWALMAHWMNVIEETGPIERDELPSLFRSFSVADDIWKPGRRGVVSLVICFGPALLVALLAPDSPGCRQLALCLLAAGAAAFPAVALTIVAGELSDLRPDRLLGMIAACGPSYLLLIFTFILATAFYVVGIILSQVYPTAQAIPLLKPLVPYGMRLGYPLLIVGIYLMHWFCWSAGLVYRQCNEQFPWTWQRYFKDRPSTTHQPARGPTRPAQKIRPRPVPNPADRQLPPVSPMSVQQLPVRGFPVIPLPAEEPPPLPIPVQPIDQPPSRTP